MDNKLLAELFNNPELPSYIYQFCMEFPEYQQAREEADVWFQKIEQSFGREEMLRFEAALSKYESWEARVSYLFGLHLRKEICAAILGE